MTEDIVIEDLTPHSSVDDLKSAVENSVTKLVPPGKTLAVFMFAGTQNDPITNKQSAFGHLGTAVKVNDKWEIAGGFDFSKHDGQTQVGGKVGVIFTWP